MIISFFQNSDSYKTWFKSNGYRKWVLIILEGRITCAMIMWRNCTFRQMALVYESAVMLSRTWRHGSLGGRAIFGKDPAVHFIFKIQSYFSHSCFSLKYNAAIILMKSNQNIASGNIYTLNSSLVSTISLWRTIRYYNTDIFPI